MKPAGRLFILILLSYLTLMLAHATLLGKTVYGDGIYYYAWVRSIVFDKDTDFTNEYAVLGGNQPPAPSGKPGNKYSIGPGLFWTPPYLITKSIVGGTGYEFPYQLSAAISSVLGAVAGLMLLFRLLAARYGDLNATLTVAAIAFGTNLLFYGAVDPVNSHAPAFFAATLAACYILELRRASFAAGFLVGLAALMRIEHGLYVLLLIPYLRAGSIIPALIGIATGLGLQSVAWLAVYGNPLRIPYLSGGEGFDLFRPQLLGSLFAPESGLISRTPVLILALYGLIRGTLTHVRMFLSPLVITLASIYLIASWSSWWQGASYGSRMSVGVLPLLALGLGEAMSVIIRHFGQKTAALLVLLLGALNALSIISFLLAN